MLVTRPTALRVVGLVDSARTLGPLESHAESPRTWTCVARRRRHPHRAAGTRLRVARGLPPARPRRCGAAFDIPPGRGILSNSVSAALSLFPNLRVVKAPYRAVTFSLPKPPIIHPLRHLDIPFWGNLSLLFECLRQCPHLELFKLEINPQIVDDSNVGEPVIMASLDKFVIGYTNSISEVSAAVILDNLRAPHLRQFHICSDSDPEDSLAASRFRSW